MIHRAPFGSFERFTGILIEHFAAAFPLWLAPEQVRVLSISEKYEDYAKGVAAKMKAAGLRVGLDLSAEKIGAKIRVGRNDLIPYLCVVGAKEEESGAVGVRGRKQGEMGAIDVDKFIADLKQEVAERRL